MYNLLLSNNHVVKIIIIKKRELATCLNFPIALFYVVFQFTVYCVFVFICVWRSCYVFLCLNANKQGQCVRV